MVALFRSSAEGANSTHFTNTLPSQILTGAEVLRQIHRAKGAYPHSNYYAENSGIGDVRLLFTVHWRDDPVNERIRVTEVIPDIGLPDAAKTALVALCTP